MTTLSLNQLWANGWTRNVSGDGAINVDENGVVQIAASTGVALITTPFITMGGFLIKARSFGMALTGTVRMFVAYDAAASDVLTEERISDGNLQNREIIGVLANSYGETTLYFGFGLKAGESGSSRFFMPRINLD